LTTFDKDILGVPAAALLLGASPKVHKKEDSLFWKLGEPIFDTAREWLQSVSKMAAKDLESKQIEATHEGPFAKMDQKLQTLKDKPRRKHKT
jgi:hypothetical protein